MDAAATFSLRRRFALVSLLVIVCIALGLGWLLSQMLTERMLRREGEVSMEFIRNLLVTDRSSGFLEHPDNRLLQERFWDRCTLFDVNFIPERMTVEELERGFRDLMVRIYDRSFVSSRRRDFFRDLRARARRADASDPRVAPRSVA